MVEVLRRVVSAVFVQYPIECVYISGCDFLRKIISNGHHSQVSILSAVQSVSSTFYSFLLTVLLPSLLL